MPSPRTFADVLERSGDAPVLVSHSACRAVHDHPRNLTDIQPGALAERGGLLGLMLLPLVVDPDRPTIEGAIDHLEHAAAVMGVERIGLGGDFTARLAAQLPTAPMSADALLPSSPSLDLALEGLSVRSTTPALEAGLRARGWSEDDVAAVTGGNVMRFLRCALPG